MGRNQITANRSIFIISTALLFVQLFDIIIHVISGQVEPIRILSNIIVMAWGVSIVFSITKGIRWISFGVLTLYLLLNIAFLFLEGLSNAYGDPRIVFYILILLTTVLSITLIRKTNSF